VAKRCERTFRVIIIIRSAASPSLVSVMNERKMGGRPMTSVLAPSFTGMIPNLPLFTIDYTS
jgi:hypothetical protein